MKTTKEMIDVMTAYEDGAELEYVALGGDSWNTDPNPNWDWSVFDYRIKEQKKIITIEKWLVTNGDRYDIAETSDIEDYISNSIGWTKVNLLETHGVKL